ncbi:MAG: hypothetical protein JST00_30015 [Deltaproteobacteria bacterium]|nr:hypothetical protein [Deltaproteobacteria bacterium]
MREGTLAVGLLAIAAALAGACGPLPGAAEEEAQNAPEVPSAPAGSNDPRDPLMEVLPDPLAALPKGTEQLKKLCARGARDKVAQTLCSAPRITSIVDLQDALGLGFKDRGSNAKNGANGNPGFAVLGNSSSLVARSVSAINPRAFVFNPPPGRPARIPGYVIMGFARGEPFVELAAEDPNTRKLTFYLLKFDVDCEHKHTCRPADLLTPKVESGWKGWSLYDDEDLKNSIADCRHCHQPNGPSSKPMLRMQELQDPWTHWFHANRPGGAALLEDFRRAHGSNEDYFGIPGSLIQESDGRAIEDFILGQGFQTQPNMFDSQRIEQEVKSSASKQPEVNTPAGTSSTWKRLYDAAASGRFIPVPYHDVKVTDPDKLDFAVSAYSKVMSGKMLESELPDIRRVFLDSALEEMTMKPKAGATGKEVLVQTCAQCHNPSLDQSVSRARFDVTKLDTMPRAMKDLAIARLKLPASDVKRMPPAIFRSLPDDALARAIQELQK